MKYYFIWKQHFIQKSSQETPQAKTTILKPLFNLILNYVSFFSFAWKKNKLFKLFFPVFFFFI